jgi:hypothetical protein
MAALVSVFLKFISDFILKINGTLSENKWLKNRGQ